MIDPHGKILVSCFASEIEKSIVDVAIHQSNEIDIYNFATGAYSPLKGFVKKEDFEHILHTMHLKDGTLWSIPIILDITSEKVEEIEKKWVQVITLITEKGIPIASLLSLEIYPFDKNAFCKSIFWTTDANHPGVQRISQKGDFLIWGDIQVLESWKVEFDDVESSFILTPAETRALFGEKWFKEIVAFQTRNVPHRGHEYIQKCALENVDALLVHPVIGEKKSGDFQNHVILGSYKILAEKYYNPERVMISCLPWVMHYAGPKEAILHAIIRQNFWCSHFIVGRDHAGVGNYYGTYDAQKIFDTISDWDLDIKILRYENAAYCPQVKWVVTDKTSPSPSAERIFISGTKFRTMLTEGVRPPEEFIRAEITDYLLSEKNIFVD